MNLTLDSMTASAFRYGADVTIGGKLTLTAQTGRKCAWGGHGPRHQRALQSIRAGFRHYQGTVSFVGPLNDPT
ncbi:hypothetical protein [Neisseria gonorrhoeae]|uniref:hypothetical protein n=1 Tax=Neisseria gonorrhoeae TaxID=485 RepID=UPI0018DFF4CC|nr:hypothetical protein [Neisseria gonorrhoeae]